MALPSADLLEELLGALEDWEKILFTVYHHGEHYEAKTEFEQEVAAARRYTNDAALVRAQLARRAFLRSDAARYVVPAPFNITFWYKEPRVLPEHFKVIRKRGASARIGYLPTRPKWLRRLSGAEGVVRRDD